MIASPSEEHTALAELVRRFFEETSPSGETRRLMETESGYDEGVWKQMAEELGLQSVAVAEERGGQGLGLAEVGIIARELGRALVCTPYLATVVLAGGAIEHAADTRAREELEGAIAAGEILALAAQRDLAATPLSARASADGFRVRGTQPHVVDGHIAERILVAAACESGIGLFRVDGAARGLERRPLRTFDRTRRLARLDFDDVPATPIGTPGADGPALERALDQATAILGGEILGGMECVLAAAADYARERRQFGRAIGSFQAVKHRAADMQIATDCALSLVDHAIESAVVAPDELALDASVAKSFVSDAFVQSARDNIQIHGGVGFTWEYDTHLYLRRARSSAVLLGDTRWHGERIARLVGVSATA
ncbi:MAG: acyl-CoA dehydrogenase family protein [Myxococcota bacterium]|nr:acyl-CoA dehydrogenase family protein [Myxococcota bacterium]